MTAKEIDELKNALDRFKARDHEQLILAHYAKEGPPDTVKIEDDMTISVFIRLLNRLFKIIEVGLVQDLFWVTDGGGDSYKNSFSDNVVYLMDEIEQNAIDHAVSYLNNAEQYLQYNGYTSLYLAFDFIEKRGVIDYSQMEERARIAVKAIEAGDEIYHQKWNELLSKQELLQALLSEAERKVSVIETFVKSGQQHAKTAQKLEEEISAVKNDAEKKLVEVNTRNETSETLAASLEVIKNELKENQAAIDAQQKQYEEFLKTVEERKQFFDTRNKELVDLIGREVGGNLFATFDKRKKELEKPVRNWAMAVIVTMAVTLGGITGIFYLTFQELGSQPFNWWMLLISSIKSAPLIIVLFFVIRQYGRERKFQEEYAFKSAVALTINAYAENLVETANHDELIMRGVQEIYRSPITEAQPRRLREKKAKELVEEVLEVAKKVKE